MFLPSLLTFFIRQLALNNKKKKKKLIMASNHRRVSARGSCVPSFKVMDILERANKLQMEGQNHVIHMEVGQPESGAPSTVAQAAIDSLNSQHVMGYTDAFGLLELRNKISELYQQKYKVTIPEQNIVITTGSSGAFLLAFTACFNTGDTVAIASSGYPCYRNILMALGCELANVKINAEFKLTATELKDEISRRRETNQKPIKGLILSSPSNPTGAMLTPEELKELCQLCDEEGIHFLSDEIYHGISYGMEEATAISFSPNVLVINSFSKYYSSKSDSSCTDSNFCALFILFVFVCLKCLGGDLVGWSFLLR